jgi:hypothetical protein
MQFRIQLLASVFCLLTLTAFAQPSTKISPADWSVFSENYEPATVQDSLFQGREGLRLDGRRTAVAFRKNMRHKNMRIDCDIAGQVMSGIGFRAKDQNNYHFLYFRTMAGGTKEAIQYVPVYNGALSWVLYHYPGYENTVDIKQLQWFHATLIVRGSVLKVFVNNSPEPKLQVDLLESDFNEGDILLRSMFGETYFANFSVTEIPELNDWEISTQFPRKPTLDLDPQTKSAKWTKVKPDAANIVNIARYVENPNGVIIARHIVKAAEDKDIILTFDFIGKLKIFLNGNELYYYEKNKLGQIFNGTQSIVMHLNKGDNDLKFVSEGDAMIFGKGFNAMGRVQHQNWGFTAELNIK